MYLDVNNLYGWAMSQKLPINGFKWVKKFLKFNERFIKSYNENSNIGYFLEVGVEQPKKSYLIFINIYHSYQKEKKYLIFMKIYHLCQREKIKGVKKFVCDIEDKEKYVVHIRALKQPLNHGLKLKNVHRVIQFNQKAWLKPYIDMNTKLRKEAKNEFEKDFFKLMNNSVFGKTMENVRNHRDIKLVTSDKKRKRLVSEPNYHSHKNFSEHLIAIE